LEVMKHDGCMWMYLDLCATWMSYVNVSEPLCNMNAICESGSMWMWYVFLCKIWTTPMMTHQA
jgi:hypothetical protein